MANPRENLFNNIESEKIGKRAVDELPLLYYLFDS